MSHHRTSRLIGLDFPLLLFLLSAVFGLWPAYDPSLCQDTLVVLVAGVLLYVLLSRLAVFHHRWRAAAAFITFTCALLSLYFVTQYDHIGYPEKVGAVSRLGVLIGRVVPPLVFWTPTANSMAAFLEGGLFLAVALVLTEERWTGRIVGAIGVGLIALALLMSASRGAWLAVAVTALLWLALYWRPARVLAAVGALAALGLIVYVVARGDITVLGDIPIIDRTLAPMFIRPDRLEVYRNSVYLIQDFPLTGIGLGGQFAMVLSKYALLIQVPFLTYSHNLYLEVWLQQGLPGITALLWLIAALYQAARTHAKPGPDLIYQSTWLGLSAIFVHGISDALQYASLWCWFPFFGLLGLNGAILLRRAPARPRGREWILPAGVAVGFLSIVAISLLPLQATWHANLGSVLQARGDLPESLADEQRADLRRQAVDNYQRALEIAPGNRTAHQRWRVILTEEERFQDAVEHLEAAQRADPNNTTTHKALGLAYVWVGELEKAQLLLQNAPDIVAELNTWGWWRGSRQQIELSLNAYRTSLLLEPNQPNVQERVEQLESE